jgi:hypothetical protein
LVLKDYLSASNALDNDLEGIQSLSRAKRFMVQNQTTIEQALEELKDLPNRRRLKAPHSFLLGSSGANTAP